MKFYVIDTFSSASFGGNPAGVIIIDEGKDFPNIDTMLEMGSDNGFSETVFVKQLSDKEFHLRYFKNSCEVDMCGHATIAAYTALMREEVVTDGTYINISQAGTMEIYISEDFVTMQMPVPGAEGDFIDSPELIDSIYSRMSLKYEKVVTESPSKMMSGHLPPILATALPDITMPVLSGDMMSLIAPELQLMSEDLDIDLEIHENNNPEEAKRPSRLIGKTEEVNGMINVYIGGAGIVLAEGNIFA